MDYTIKSFHPNDYSLAQLACEAAITIDYHIKNIDEPLLKDYKSVRRLGKIMYMATISQKRENNFSYIAVRDDPVLSLFLAKLFEKHTEIKPKTIDDVISETEKISLNLIKMKELTIKQQRKLSNFCLELSKTALYYWDSIHPDGFKQYAS